jgi:hypothetical protein
VIFIKIKFNFIREIVCIILLKASLYDNFNVSPVSFFYSPKTFLTPYISFSTFKDSLSCKAHNIPTNPIYSLKKMVSKESLNLFFENILMFIRRMG